MEECVTKTHIDREVKLTWKGRGTKGGRTIINTTKKTDLAVKGLLTTDN